MDPIATHPTRGGCTVNVYGPNSWGGYSDHCTGCDTRTPADDTPADRAEEAAKRWATYHARHCAVFHPVLHTDMEASHYTLLVASMDEDGELIAVGENLTPRRALAAFSAYTRTTCGAEDQALLHERLTAGLMTITVRPTVFLRESDGAWNAQPRPDSKPAAWLAWQ